MTEQIPATKPSDGASHPHTAYLASHYPALSHSFIQREVQALRRQGVEVETFTIHRSPRAEMKTEAMQAEDAATTAIVTGNKTGIVTAMGRLAKRDPRALIGAAGRAVRTGYPSAKARLWQIFYLAEAVALHERLAATGIRHIHAHHANVASDVARLTADLGNRLDGEGTWSWSFTMHGSAEFDNVREHDLPAKAHDAAGVSAISHYARAQVIRHLDPQEWDKVEIAHMSVDPDIFVPPPGGRMHGGLLRLVTVGRLHPVKGFDVLIDAVVLVRDRDVDVEVRIVGHGPLQDELQQRIDDHGLHDVVTLTGPLGEEEIVAQLQWSDIFVSSSFMEGLPVVLMEAMATEAVPIATQVAAVPELVVNGVNGRIVAPSDVEELANAIVQLGGDPELRREMGRRGREKVLEGFTTRAAGPRMADFLRRVAR